jgi:hypothetical protein
VANAAPKPGAGCQQHAGQCHTLGFEAESVEEDHGFRAFARHRQRGNQTDPQRAGVFLGLRFEFVFHAAAMAVHPQHHLQDQAGGNQHHRKLELFQRRTGEFALDGIGGIAERQGQGQPRARASPHAAPERGLLRVRLASDPRQENADDQHGFEAFAPDDDEGIEHDACFRD